MAETPEAGHAYDWKAADGTLKWYLSGDHLWTTGGTDNIATFDFKTLKAGDYKLTRFSQQNVDVKLEINGVQTPIGDVAEYEFTLDTDSTVKLLIASKDDTQGEYVAPRFYKVVDGTDNLIHDNFVMDGRKTLEATGWTAPEGSSWQVSGYDGLTCKHHETESVYRVQNVTPDVKYHLECTWNEHDLFKMAVTDMEGNEIASGNEEFTVPEGTSQVKVVISYNEDAPDHSQDEYQYRIDNVDFVAGADIRLGDYDESKAKYSGSAKLKDVNTCMDYAYYMLNNFWLDTQRDITYKTKVYKAIQLDLGADGSYSFDNGNVMTFDVNSGLISQNPDARDNSGFYPLDAATLGAKSDLKAPFAGEEFYNPYDEENHNYHFSMQGHAEFLYEKDKDYHFTFRGDDDVYLFIDNKLVLDIGGAHTALEQSVDIDEFARKIGLVDGEVYNFDFFYMDRHTTDSNIYINTNLILQPAEAKASVTYKDSEGNKLGNNAKVEVGDEVELNYSVKASGGVVSNVTFKDTVQDVTIGKDGIDLGDQGVYVKDEGITVDVLDKNGAVKESFNISKEDLNNPDKVKEFCEKMGDVQLNNNESLRVSGLYKDVTYDERLKSTLEVTATTPSYDYDASGEVVHKDEPLDVDSVNVGVTPKSTPQAEVDVTFVDEHGDALDGDVVEGDKVGLTYDLTAKSPNMKDLGLNDAGTGFQAGKDGVVIPDGYYVGADGLTFELKKADGTVSETITVTAEDIQTKSAKYQELLEKLESGWELSEGDSITISGLYTDIGKTGISSDVTASAYGPNPQYVPETDTVDPNWTEVNPTVKKALGDVVGKVNVSFDAGARGTVSTPSSYSINEGTSVPNVPTVSDVQTGYDFKGWKMVGDTSGKVYTDEEIKGMTFEKDTEFTAEYEQWTVDVTFEQGDHGTLTGDTEQSVLYGEGVDSVPSAKAEAGYGFTGWTMSGDASGKLYQASDIKEMTFTEDTTFTAQYELGKVTVTFEQGDYGTLTGETNQSIDYGTGVGSVPESTAQEHYVFKGWKMAGDDTVYTEDDIKGMTFTEDTTFTAYYEGEPCNVTYEAGDHGSIDGDTKETVLYGDKPANVPTPKADKGYKFAGWTKSVTAGDSSVDSPKDETITEDTVFSAVFEPVYSNYTVKYVDENGNEIFNAKAGEETQVGETVTEEAVNVEGYELTGEAKQSLEIGENAEENVITFVYKKKPEPTTQEPTTQPTTQQPTTEPADTQPETEAPKKESATKKKQVKNNKKTTEKQEETTGIATPQGTQNGSLVSPQTGYEDHFGFYFALFVVFVALGGYTLICYKKED